MPRVLKKVYVFSSILFIVFILLFIAGCVLNKQSSSAASQSITLKDQKLSENPGEENETEKKGVPLPPDEANGIYIVDDLAFVADYKKGLSVYDISDRLNPVKISEIDLPGDGMDVFVLDKFAYVASGNSGLQIIDISDINNMKLISSYKNKDSSIDYATRLQVKDDMVFLSDGIGGLKIIDVGNKLSPQIISTFDSTYQGSIEDVIIEGETAFLADYRAGFIVVDITDLNNPKLVSETRTTGMAKGLCRIKRNEDRSYVMVADYKSIQVIDVSDISKPIIAGNYEGLKNVVNITSSGDTAFAADYNLGLVQLDITEITKPILINTFDTGKTNDVFIHEGYIYAVGEKGISVFAIE